MVLIKQDKYDLSSYIDKYFKTNMYLNYLNRFGRWLKVLYAKLWTRVSDDRGRVHCLPDCFCLPRPLLMHSSVLLHQMELVGGTPWKSNPSWQSCGGKEVKQETTFLYLHLSTSFAQHTIFEYLCAIPMVSARQRWKCMLPWSEGKHTQ